MDKKKILVILTGGTIGSLDEGSVIDLNSSVAYSLIARSCEKFGFSPEDFEVVSPFSTLSENITPNKWELLLCALRAVAQSDYDGIIVTHGSDTLSFTSALVGLCFADTKIPIVLIASNYTLTDPRSNGLYNFSSAVSVIREQKVGVFVCYRSNSGEDTVYLATRLLNADYYCDSFSGFGGVPFGSVENGRLVLCNSVINNIDLTDTLPIAMPKSFESEVLMLSPYPGLDYTSIVPNEKVKAILQLSYHSATACTDEDELDYSLCEFAKKCSERGIDVYLASFKSLDSSLYHTSRELLGAGVIPLMNISPESAYAKLLLAYNQAIESPREIMQKNYAFEILPTP